jgi:hypothetical protein
MFRAIGTTAGLGYLPGKLFAGEEPVGKQVSHCRWD